ncbi:periplasmic binding protein-like II [Piromyces finnis]|uniref:Periplasmic binding protein-like II n=1 Tax=Piromyces finnis TaxID=1754191 RepID=A0A1Y1V7I3_9FUNG|nr:periplasmic binding protein-like II [Piromyces finnis]|eukprot:ORX49029.1 periplasmic binding protein-like II [Piromyces finnis]
MKSTFFLLILYFLLFFILYNNECSAVVLKSLAISYNDDNSEYLNFLVRNFNNYSKENDLDIELEITLYTPSNSSNVVSDYKDTLEHLLNRKSTKYDIYIYNILHTSTYSSYFVDLNKYIPEYVDMYSQNIFLSLCTENGKWIGLPLHINFSILYSNKELLKKYNKSIPTTWDELYETAKYIYNEELKAGNKDIIGFNGLFSDDSEEGLQSISAFVYSYRPSKNSTFPNYKSKEAIKALEMIKKMKSDLLPAYISTYITKDVDDRIVSGKAVFLKFWMYDYANSVYEKSVSLGDKEGISGSYMDGSSISINKYISDSNIESSVEVLKFFLSREMQKHTLLNYKVLSGIKNLYDDKDVCKFINCEIINKIQILPELKTLNDYDYYVQYKVYLSNYLRKNETIETTSRQLDDITKIYHISIGVEDSPIGLIVFVIVIFLILMMLFSLVFLFIPKFEPYFEFLTKDFWILIVTGSIAGLITVLSFYGEMVPYKCFINYFSIAISFTLRIIPILQRLISNFPGENWFVNWVRNNKYLFVNSFITFDLILGFISHLVWYDVINIYVPYNKNYKACVVYENYANFTTYLTNIEKFLVISSVIILLFMEWNIEKTKDDIKTVSQAFSLNSFVFVLLNSFNFLNFRDYFGFFFVMSLLNILFSVSNFFFIYGARILWILKKKERDKERQLESVIMKFKLSSLEDENKNYNNINFNLNLNDNNNNNNQEESQQDCRTYTTYSRSSAVLSKMINYHYYTGEQKHDSFIGDISLKVNSSLPNDVINNRYTIGSTPKRSSKAVNRFTLSFHKRDSNLYINQDQKNNSIISDTTTNTNNTSSTANNNGNK